MSANDYSDAALVIVAHGSTVNEDSAIPARQHADALRRHGLFASVEPAFWKQAPFAREVVARAPERRVFIVPLFVSDGYFSDVIIPADLGFRTPTDASWSRVRRRPVAQRPPGCLQTLFYCEPIGSHASMADVLLARAGEALRESTTGMAPRLRETALFIAGHGTPRNENSRRTIERHAASLRARNVCAEVHAVFLEEEPRVSECYELTSLPDLVVVPFFISDGMHTCDDIPLLLGRDARPAEERPGRGGRTWINPTECRGRRVWYARSVGTEPLVADVILQRVREAESWATILDPGRG